MKVSSLLSEKNIKIGIPSETKEKIIESLIDILVKSGKIRREDRAKVIKAVVNREKLGSTGLERGIAVPHAKTDAVPELLMALGIAKEGVPFDSIDGSGSHLFFLLLAPPEITGPHLRTLAEIATLTQDSKICEKLIRSKTAKEVIGIINNVEKNQKNPK